MIFIIVDKYNVVDVFGLVFIVNTFLFPDGGGKTKMMPLIKLVLCRKDYKPKVCETLLHNIELNGSIWPHCLMWKLGEARQIL